MNPIVHYFFTTTTIEQLLSPIFTLLFTIFYPLVALLHILQIGGLLDNLLLSLINYNLNSTEVTTPLFIFVFYICISIFSIFNKKIFFLLNFSFIIFNFLLFIK
jgi:competence protein ComEC